MCQPFVWHTRLSVKIHRNAAVRMIKELLYHLHFLVVLSEQSCVRVTEGVEPDPHLDLRRLHCRSPVFRLPSLYSGAAGDKRSGEAFRKILEKARSRNLEVKTDMAVGHPAEQIIHRAEMEGIDLIILGRRGRSMISRMMLGSVSERALRYAHCPVMVVH